MQVSVNPPYDMCTGDNNETVFDQEQNLGVTYREPGRFDPLERVPERHNAELLCATAHKRLIWMHEFYAGTFPTRIWPIAHAQWRPLESYRC